LPLLVLHLLAMPIVDSDVTIKTPDGMCDAAFIHPTTDSHPGVMIDGRTGGSLLDARYRQVPSASDLKGGA
jgi:hypothetical protein